MNKQRKPTTSTWISQQPQTPALASGLLLLTLSAGSYADAICTINAIQAMAPADTTISTAASIAEPTPHCRIDGHVTTTDPGPNQVNFRLQLPDSDWNGRYYFIGVGATGGAVPTDSQIPAGNPLLRGFAVAGTDTGHQSVADWTFLAESEAKALDHAHRGAHVTAVATQQITRQYYDADSMYRYHSGCSGGGRMGMEIITRHPGDYDGVLLGAPGIGPERGAETMLAFIYAAQQMHREPGAWVSPAKLAMAEQHVTQACDALDGATDDMIWEHETCSYDFKQLQCPSGDSDDCLTAPEIRTIEALLRGPHGPAGPIKSGFPISNMSSWSLFLGMSPPPWPEKITRENFQQASPGYMIGNTLAQAYFGKDFQGLTDFDFNDQAQLDAWWAAAERIGYGYSMSTDISGVEKAGGKIIFWNGVSDPCCIDTELIKYYNDAGTTLGGMDRLASFSRFYRIPGMAHCGAGTGPQDAPDKMLEALIDWVENDKPPAGIVTHRGDRAELLFADPDTGTVSGVVVPPSQGSARDFLICPYPQKSVFNGKTGGEMDADNWSCKSL